MNEKLAIEAASMFAELEPNMVYNGLLDNVSEAEAAAFAVLIEAIWGYGVASAYREEWARANDL